MAQKRKTMKLVAAAGSPDCKRSKPKDPTFLPITESLELLQGAAILMDMMCQECRQEWQKPEEVKRAQGSGKLAAGKCKMDQLVAGGMVQEWHWWAERENAPEAEKKSEVGSSAS